MGGSACGDTWAMKLAVDVVTGPASDLVGVKVNILQSVLGPPKQRFCFQEGATANPSPFYATSYNSISAMRFDVVESNVRETCCINM